MTLKVYAKHRGVSPAAVRRAIESRRLVESVERDEATGVWSIDQIAADAEWEAHTDPNMQRRPDQRRGGAPPPGPMTPEQRQLLLELEREVEALGSMDLSAAGHQPFPEDARGDLNRLREVQAEYEARLKHLQFERERGALVPVEEVRKASYRVWRTHREKLMAIPPRIAGVLAAEADSTTCERILAEELTAALAEVSDQLRRASDAPPTVEAPPSE